MIYVGVRPKQEKPRSQDMPIDGPASLFTVRRSQLKDIKRGLQPEKDRCAVFPLLATN